MAAIPARIVVSVVDRASKAFIGIASNMKLVAGAAATLGVYAIGRQLTTHMTRAIGVAAEFEQQLSRVRAVTGASETEISKLADQSLALGRTTVFTARQVAKAQATLAKAGFETTEIYDAIPGVMSLAAAGELEVGNAAEIAAQLVRTFGLEASATTDVADLLSKAANSANTTVEELGEAFAFAGPAASLMGLSMTETAAALQVVTDRGLKASLGGTSLGKTITTLGGQVNKLEGATGLGGLEARLFTTEGAFVGWSKAIAVMKEAGVDASNVFNIFGVRAGKAAGFLTKFDKELEQNTIELLNRSGNAARTSATKLNNLTGDIDLLRAAWEGLNIAVGTAMQDSARIMVRQLTFVINALTDAGAAGDSFGESVIGINTAMENIVSTGLRVVKWVSKIWTGITWIVINGFKFILDSLDRAVNLMTEPFFQLFKMMGKMGSEWAQKQADDMAYVRFERGLMSEALAEYAEEDVASNMLFTHGLDQMIERMPIITQQFREQAEERRKERQAILDGLTGGEADVVDPGARGTSDSAKQAQQEQLQQQQQLIESQLALMTQFGDEEIRLRREQLELKQEAELLSVQEGSDAELSMRARHVNELIMLDRELANERIELDAQAVARRAAMVEAELMVQEDATSRLEEQAATGTAAQLQRALDALNAERAMRLEAMVLRHEEEKMLREQQNLETETLEAEHKARMMLEEDEYHRRRMAMIAAQSEFVRETADRDAKNRTEAAWMAADEGVKIMGDLFGKNKAFAIAGAIISTARGVAKALEQDPPKSYVLAAITAAKGLIEIKKIKGTKTPKHQTGGILTGPPGVDMTSFMGTPGELIADTTASEARQILSGQAAIVPAGQASAGGGTTIIVQGDVLDADAFFRRHAQSLGIGLAELDDDGDLI